MFRQASAIGLLALFLSFSQAMAQTPKMRFELVGNGGNCVGCEWILAEGEIAPETPAAFDEFIRRHGSNTIVFNSPGGSLVAGLELGQRIRRLKMHTEVGVSRKDEFGHHEIVPGVCASACAYAFLGGVRRSIGNMFAANKNGIERSRIGVHRFFRPDALSNMDAKQFAARDLDAEQRITALLAVYMVTMGIDARLLGLAAEADANSMRWLTDQEIEDLRVAYDPEEFQPWAIEPYQNGAIAFTKTRNESTTISVFCRKRNEVSVLINAPGLSPDSASRLRECSIGQENTAFGVTFPMSAVVRGPIVTGRPTLLIRLQGAPIGHDETIRFDVARACRFDFNTSKKRMAETIRLAMRNCL